MLLALHNPVTLSAQQAVTSRGPFEPQVCCGSVLVQQGPNINK